jgi:hypothetical protein
MCLQLEQKQVVPPFKPRLEGERDLANFPPEFTDEPVHLTPDNESVHLCLNSSINTRDTRLSPQNHEKLYAHFNGFFIIINLLMSRRLGAGAFLMDYKKENGL